MVEDRQRTKGRKRLFREFSENQYKYWGSEKRYGFRALAEIMSLVIDRLYQKFIEGIQKLHKNLITKIHIGRDISDAD